MSPQSVYPTLTQCLSHVPGKFACRILIQEIGFALPVTITMPVVILLLITLWDRKNRNYCPPNGTIPDYFLFLSSPSSNDVGNFLTSEVRNHCLLQKMVYMQKPIINCLKKTNLMHNLFLVYFVNLYMFRAFISPSSGGTTVCIKQLLLTIFCR